VSVDLLYRSVCIYSVGLFYMALSRYICLFLCSGCWGRAVALALDVCLLNGVPWFIRIGDMFYACILVA